jgi:hypothetical protein
MQTAKERAVDFSKAWQHNNQRQTQPPTPLFEYFGISIYVHYPNLKKI